MDQTVAVVDDQDAVFPAAEHPQAMHHCPGTERQKRKAVWDETALRRSPEPPRVGRIEAERSHCARDFVATVEEESRRGASAGRSTRLFRFGRPHATADPSDAHR